MLCALHFRCRVMFVVCSRRQSRVYFVHSPACHAGFHRFFFVYCVRIVFGQRLLRAASIDLEDCLDLAIRKGKAVGETKPTESKRAIIVRPASCILRSCLSAVDSWSCADYKSACFRLLRSDIIRTTAPQSRRYCAFCARGPHNYHAVG